MSDEITVNDGSADVVYREVSAVGQESIFRDLASTSAEPRIIRCAYTTKNEVERGLVQVNRIDLNIDGESKLQGTHLVLTKPVQDATEAACLAEWTKLKNLVTANFSMIYAGFQPVD